MLCARLALVTVLMLLAAPCALAMDNIDAELGAAAKEIQKFLAGRAAKAVSVGAIRSASDEKISHGPGLGLRLKARLAEAGMTIATEARFGIVGEYAWKEDPKTKRVIIQLDLWVVDRQKADAKLVTISRGIHGEDALVELLAPAVVALPPGTAEERREAILIETIEKQPTKLSAVFDEAVIYPDASKTYGLQIQVKGPDGTYLGRRPRVEDGDLLIELKKGETFRVLLHNNSRFEAAATIMIDGLNTFSFGAFEKMTEKPKWLVSAGKVTTLVGWPSGNGRAHEFLVTNYAQSAIAELGGDKAQLGVLTVKFAASWPKNATRPADEPDLVGSRGDTGIGRGAEVEAPIERVERTFGRTRAVISIRYNKD